jgi:CheY-like chemotaxis protein
MGTQKYSPRILLVEDDAATRRLTSCALRHAGFEVVEACTADDGVTRIGDPSIDAIITDVEMPGTLNGYDLAWQAHIQKPAAPVFVVSACQEVSIQIGAICRLKPTSLTSVLIPGSSRPNCMVLSTPSIGSPLGPLRRYSPGACQQGVRALAPSR